MPGEKMGGDREGARRERGARMRQRNVGIRSDMLRGQGGRVWEEGSISLAQEERNWEFSWKELTGHQLSWSGRDREMSEFCLGVN